MKISGRFSVLIILSILNLPLRAQEIIFNISGKYNNTAVPIDSIRFGNLTNGEELFFVDLPDREEYTINLTTQELVDPIGINSYQNQSSYRILKCIPGELVITYRLQYLTDATIEIFNISGQVVHSTSLLNMPETGSISIRFGKEGIYFVRFQNPEEIKVFRGIGWGDREAFEVLLHDVYQTDPVTLKSEVVSSQDDFAVHLGDSLKVSAFKDSLIADPVVVKVEENNTIEFSFTQAPTIDTTKVIDINGNIYDIVRIGDQYWMAGNLKTTHYANGDPIPDGTGIGDYSLETYPEYWFAYNDSLEYVDTYGRLYTWYAASDPRNVCPDGWYLPGDAEWTTLETYLGGMEVAGGKMKETGMEHWQSPNEGATNESGFNALPGGARLFYGGFNFIGIDGHWWSSTHASEGQAWYRYMSHFAPSIMRADPDKRYGFSVRCIKDTGTPGTFASLVAQNASDITDTSATVAWMITNDGGSEVTETGIYWGTEANPRVTGSRLAIGTGTGEFTTELTSLSHSSIYHFTAYAVNSAGEITSNEKIFLTTILYDTSSVSDMDGNNYRTVKLWDKWWMAENLRVTSFADGSPIPQVTDNTAWTGLTGPGYCWYNNDSASHQGSYGILYNWHTVNAGNLCPTGWRVPTYDEWTMLIDHLGSLTIAGGMLKEIGTNRWNSPNTGATDEAGLTALPGGLRRTSGTFYGMGSTGTWWSSTESPYDVSMASNLNLYSGSSNAGFRSDGKNQGSSVRCIKDTLSTGPKSILNINEDEFDLVDGILANYGDFEGAGVYNHTIYLLSSGHEINWETLEVAGSGAVVDLEIFNTGPQIDNGFYPFSIPEVMNTVKICDSIDRNDDGVINDYDCYYTLPEGTFYISSRISAYDRNANLNDMEGLEFASGSATISTDGDLYIIEFNGTGLNGDVVSGYYKGSLHYYDFSNLKSGKYNTILKQ